MQCWPLYDLRVRTDRLELRLPDLPLLGELVALASRGVHPPESMPFQVPWTDLPSPQMEREAFQYHLLQVAQWKPARWTFNPVVLHQGEVIGTQSIEADDFSVSRSFRTGSWLGQAFQGRGFGKEMRAAILHLGFLGLGAEEALTSAFQDNAASIGVNRSLAYQDNGTHRTARRGQAATHLDFRLSRALWEARHTLPVRIEGLEPCLWFFGATTPEH